MAERHEALNSQALDTLLRKHDRVSLISDGFGDFCFWPEPFRCLNCAPPPWPPERLRAWESGPNILEDDPRGNAPVGEIEGPAFAFLRLPRDVRDMIYGLCVEPFRNPQQNGLINLNIGVVYNRRCHPFRNGYELYAPPALTSDGWSFRPSKHDHIKRSNYNSIWSLSRVNHQVRIELGIVFWKNICIEISHWEYLFIDFLKDRPAVCQSIKKLRMDWACGFPKALNDNIEEFCKYISKHLILDELVLCLEASEKTVREILSSGDKLRWVKAFRKINVRKLIVDLGLHDNGSVDDDSDDESVEGGDTRKSILARELEPLMEEFLHPSPVLVVEISEEQAYMQSRLVDTELPRPWWEED